LYFRRAPLIEQRTFMGDVGRKTRIIHRNRDGRPRSWMKNAAPSVEPTMPVQWQMAETCLKR
jgi:hypothetical protein